MEFDERAARQRFKNDFLHYAEKCLCIRTKSGALASLKLNRAQKMLHRRLERQLKTTGKIRALILKGRQQGCSTYTQARFYWKVTHRKGVRAFILTHLDEATRNLHQIVKRFHAHCPGVLRPETSHSNAREFLFGRLESGYRVGTAKSDGTGRSDTIQFFHGSEVAYWTNAKSHMAGVLQAVPDMPGTEIILESTSDGPDGLFYEMCRAAETGDSPYDMIFIPWFWQTEYRTAPPKNFDLTAEERDYKTAFGLTRPQMAWRRNKIFELGGLHAFRREYPATPEEAFHSDVPGALWSRDLLDRNRISGNGIPQMARIVVAVDPAVTSGKNSDETGIIIAGLGENGHGYVLEDLSGRYSPNQWARTAIAACYRWQADRIVAESNQGGEMVAHTIRTQDSSAPLKLVHASRGKRTRAEPVAALDEQGKIHHAGVFAKLEDQMCRYDFSGGQTASPDRVDARVWAFTELMLGQRSAGPRAWRG